MCSIFILMVWIVLSSEGSLINNDFCEYKCRLKNTNETIVNIHKANGNLCSLDNIPNNVIMTVMETAEGVSSDGIVRVNFNPPKEECHYKVALVVNPLIKNSEECEKHVFHAKGIDAEEIHTAEKSYCILNNHLNKSQELQIPYCQDQKLAMWYENIFTGCYALRFRISENEFVFRGQIFMETDHLHSSINAPEFHCKYTSVPSDNHSFEKLTFSTSTSNVVHFAGLQQQIAVLSPLDRDQKNSCVKFNKHTIFSHTIYTDKINATSNNCTLTIAEKGLGQNVECNFDVESSKNTRFCFVIHFLDDRCKRATRWNPPIKGYLPCTWVQNLKEEDDSKYFETDEFRYEVDIKRKEKENDIIIIYVKGSKPFMKMMSDFRNILERCLKCHVYDWFAPEEWDNVATVGGYEWVGKLLKKDCRVVWIDTSKARSLFASQYNLIDTNVSRNKKIEEFSDFRDCVFPAIVDLAKRSLKHIVLQYSRHFVVRIEGFETLDEGSDPFSDLSPHARYIIPHHLRELCSHLSMPLSVPEKHVQLEERRLRQHLVSDDELESNLIAVYFNNSSWIQLKINLLQIKIEFHRSFLALNSI
ncbi:uncharacterized protein LOC127284613 isoform X2 [Leptopilina boulardi]|uniref:uncharacterized protein LOC127284613 isoform X2 n=1 Tax=Leptopilina boulardi TaxID=63433 RepID=UPI0021F6714D|nr:uncharacterized protein LOC127284613 isoform X2 [Leptopilina boulardi]